jgi:hypothetical protein
MNREGDRKIFSGDSNIHRMILITLHRGKAVKTLYFKRYTLRECATSGLMLAGDRVQIAMVSANIVTSDIFTIPEATPIH